MEAINRLKAVLADTGKTNKWLAEQLGKDPVTVSKWCITRCQARCDTVTVSKWCITRCQARCDIDELIETLKR